MRVKLYLVRCLLVMALSCSDPGIETPLDPDVPPITEGTWFRPAPPATWQWQLQGALNTAYDVDVYDVDLLDTGASTIASIQARVLCYFSAGSFEDFRPLDVPDSARGKRLDGFP